MRRRGLSSHDARTHALAGNEQHCCLRSVCFACVRLPSDLLRLLLPARAVLFSCPNAGALSARLETDASLVRVLAADGVFSIATACATGLSGLAIAFAGGWQLTLVMLGVLPLLLAAMLTGVKVFSSLSRGTKNQFERATQVSMDAVGNIRTVASFTAQPHVLNHFEKELEGPIAAARKKALTQGVSAGIAISMIPFTEAFIFYIGGIFIDRGIMCDPSSLRLLLPSLPPAATFFLLCNRRRRSPAVLMPHTARIRLLPLHPSLLIPPLNPQDFPGDDAGLSRAADVCVRDCNGAPGRGRRAHSGGLFLRAPLIQRMMHHADDETCCCRGMGCEKIRVFALRFISRVLFSFYLLSAPSAGLRADGRHRCRQARRRVRLRARRPGAGALPCSGTLSAPMHSPEPPAQQPCGGYASINHSQRVVNARYCCQCESAPPALFLCSLLNLLRLLRLPVGGWWRCQHASLTAAPLLLTLFSAPYR